MPGNRLTDTLPLKSYTAPPLIEAANIFQSKFSTQSTVGLSPEAYTTYSQTFVADPVGSGSMVYRYELRKTDGIVDGSIRSEVYRPLNPITSMDYTYRWSYYLPSAYWAPDNILAQELLMQLYQTPDPVAGDGSFSPPWALIVVGANLQIWSRTYAFSPLLTNTTAKITIIDIGPYLTDQWVDYTLYINQSYGPDGYFAFYVNGIKVASLVGANMYNNIIPTFMKSGIYKFSWHANPSDSVIDTRVVYQRNMRLDYGDTRYQKLYAD